MLVRTTVMTFLSTPKRRFAHLVDVFASENAVYGQLPGLATQSGAPLFLQRSTPLFYLSWESRRTRNVCTSTHLIAKKSYQEDPLSPSTRGSSSVILPIATAPRPY
ncbi:hypothetical protein BD309DRAFT_147224 [Dichomitus squalens]|nr:hypothetical protein BD309DRAFT_147224 [Dichomitus squalens]